MESFNLNIIPGKDRPVCHASQFDIGRQFHVNLFEGFNVFTLDGTETISLSVRKPDGNVVTASVTNTSDNYVEFVTTEQMTACEGSNLCELKLEKGSDVIGTANFILEVELDPLEGGVQSASEIDNLQTQVAGMVATEVADQYDSANVIFDAVPTAGHGVGYAVTSEGVASEISTVNNAIALKQDITDANLQTTDTTIVGAINELNSDKQNATDNSLSTNNKTVVGAINELNSALWEDLSSSVVSTSNIEGLIYKRHKPTGLKFIYFEIKAGVSDNTILISSLPNTINSVPQAIPVSLLNYESIQLGIFSVYHYSDSSVVFRCKTPTSNVKVYASGFLL